MKNTKRKYSTDFKEKAVQLSYQRENIKELADGRFN
jgi:transposase-like protein